MGAEIEVRGSRDPWLLAVLAVTAALGLYQLDWGLPNGNNSWAADALGPLTVLSIARRSFGAWNSGWFYFKYPLGYPLLLLATYAPYLTWLKVTGQWEHPQSAYPYGFADPEAALYALAMLGRGLSVLLTLGTVACVYGIGRRLLGRSAGILAAWFTATAYPVIYYAHTTNLDAAYLFWLTLGLWATIVATEESKRRWAFVVVGIAAAMAMATKEQGYALLLAYAALIAVYAWRAQRASTALWVRAWRSVWNTGTRTGLAAAVITMALASNVMVNPQGAVNRFLNLAGREVPGVTARFTPVEFALFKGAAKEWQYLRQAADALESSLGLPLLAVALAGLAFVAVARPRARLRLLLPVVAYYFVSLRTHDLIMLRYTLPLQMLLAVSAAALCAAVVAARPRSGGVVVAALMALALARGIELNLLLSRDSRYAAETWVAAQRFSPASIETYQKPVYLPRLDGLGTTIALRDRSLEGIAARRPAAVILSSAARKGITHRWNPDWRQGNTLLVESPPAAALLSALEEERLPYRRLAQFSQTPMLLRVRITSLCPTISVYGRVDS